MLRRGCAGTCGLRPLEGPNDPKESSMIAMRTGTALALMLVALLVSPVAAVTITEFPITTAASSVRSITAGPDGNLWFTEFFGNRRSEEHTSELQSHVNLVCRLLLEK